MRQPTSISPAALTVAALVACAGAAAPAAGQSLGVSAVVLSGRTAPGLPSTTRLAGFSDAVVSGHGAVAFVSTLAGTRVSAANNRAIFVRSVTGGLSLAARSGSRPAALPMGTALASFSDLRVNDLGQIAFLATLAGSRVTSTSDRAILAGAPGGLGLVARTGDLAAGVPAGWRFKSLQNPALGDGGHVAFFCLFADPARPAASDQGIYVGPGQNAALLARTDMQAPGLAAGVVFNTLGAPAVNVAGAAAFRGFLRTNASLGVLSSSADVLVAGAPGAARLVTRAGETVSGLGGPRHDAFNTPSIADDGTVAYGGSLIQSGPVNSTNDLAVFRAAGDGPAVSVMRLGDAVPTGPGLAPGETFGPMGSPLVNAQGDLAVRTTIVGPGVQPGVNDAALWTVGPAGLALVARAGQTPPGAPEGVTIAAIGAFALNDRGQLAMHVTLAGPGVTAASDQAVLAFDPERGLLAVAREGQTLDVAPGVARTLATLGFVGGSGGGDGRSSGLSDLGRVVFSATFTDGGAGVLAAQLPASLADVASTSGAMVPDGAVTPADFTAFTAAFAAGSLRADVASANGSPGGDGTLDGGDYLAFMMAYQNAASN